jgi:uncharacterized protein (TIGR00645 family)
MIKDFEKLVAALITGSRWLMALFYIGLIVVLFGVLARFVQALIRATIGFASIEPAQFIVAALKLVDLVLIGNLIVVLISAGLDSLLSVGGTKQLGWMGQLDFAGIKLKLIALIAAITAIDLLETFINVSSMDKRDVLWEILILLTIVVAGILLALMDRISGERHD